MEDRDEVEEYFPEEHYETFIPESPSLLVRSNLNGLGKNIKMIEAGEILQEHINYMNKIEEDLPNCEMSFRLYDFLEYVSYLYEELENLGRGFFDDTLKYLDDSILQTETDLDEVVDNAFVEFMMNAKLPEVYQITIEGETHYVIETDFFQKYDSFIKLTFGLDEEELISLDPVYSTLEMNRAMMDLAWENSHDVTKIRSARYVLDFVIQQYNYIRELAGRNGYKGTLETIDKEAAVALRDKIIMFSAYPVVGVSDMTGNQTVKFIGDYSTIYNAIKDRDNPTYLH